jgi:hypothetical protein
VATLAEIFFAGEEAVGRLVGGGVYPGRLCAWAGGVDEMDGGVGFFARHGDSRPDAAIPGVGVAVNGEIG